MEEKSILYSLYTGRFPGERAAALYAAQTAAAFSPYAQVRLLLSRRLGRGRDARAVYRLPVEVSLIFFPTIDLFWVPWVRRGAYLVHASIYALCVFFYLLFARRGFVLAVELIPALAATYTGQRVIFEVHDFPEKHLFLYRILLRRCAYIVATNMWKKGALQELFPESAHKVVMERNGVDLDLFSPRTKDESRAVLGLQTDRPLFIYTGHLYGWKGVDLVLRAAAKLTEATFIFVGGAPEDIARLTSVYGKSANIRFIGHVEHARMPLWQAAADVLVLPNTAQESIAERYTSPMKLFEYLASGRPILASRLPSITEIVDDTTAYLFEPDNEDDFVRAAKELLGDPREADRRATRNQNRAQSFSWDARAERLSEVWR